MTAPMETTDSTDPNFKKPIPLKQSCYDPDDPLCLPGPSPDDPDPDAPGYFIGPDYNMDHCTLSNDYDDDGFDDNCEYRIARRFAPVMATNPGYDTSREPYWVARYVDDLPYSSSNGIVVMYLFSYHMDWGDPFFGGGHSGDSEFVVLYVEFDDASEHWQLAGAYYAAHHGQVFDYDTWYGPYSALPTPDVERGYPRVWVAKGKNASYPSKRMCNDGGFGDGDDCNGNIDEGRLDVSRFRNLGSANHRFYNCVYSENPISYPGTECFWNSVYDFCGWDLDRTQCSTPYADHLAEFGFGEFE